MTVSPETRYEIFVDPLDRHTVWDNAHDAPAMWSGEPLVGLNKIHALAALKLLEQQDVKPSRRRA